MNFARQKKTKGGAGGSTPTSRALSSPSSPTHREEDCRHMSQGAPLPLYRWRRSERETVSTYIPPTPFMYPQVLSLSTMSYTKTWYRYCIIVFLSLKLGLKRKNSVAARSSLQTERITAHPTNTSRTTLASDSAPSCRRVVVCGACRDSISIYRLSFTRFSKKQVCVFFTLLHLNHTKIRMNTFSIHTITAYQIYSVFCVHYKTVQIS